LEFNFGTTRLKKTFFLIFQNPRIADLGSSTPPKKKKIIIKELWNPIISKKLKELTIFYERTGQRITILWPIL